MRLPRPAFNAQTFTVPRLRRSHSQGIQAGADIDRRFLHQRSMEALSGRGAPSCSSLKLWRSLTSDTLVECVVCAVHDVRIPSAVTAQPKVRRSEYPFIDSARFKFWREVLNTDSDLFLLLPLNPIPRHGLVAGYFAMAQIAVCLWRR